MPPVGAREPLLIKTRPMTPFHLNSLSRKQWPHIEILDIGAMPEGAPRYQRLLDLGQATVTSFEPQEEQRQALLASKKGKGRVLPHILGDGRPGVFHITRYPGCTSLLEPDPAVIDLFCHIDATEPDGNFTVIRQEPVETVRLDDIDVCPQADYVKIDIQGSELTVLENGLNKISQALVIETEAEFLPVYKNQPLFCDLQNFLRSQGFMFHKFIDIAGRTFRPMRLPQAGLALSQALWSDAVFVRDFTSLERFSDEQLLKAALVLHEAYFSYDLALRLLLEHDRRTQGGAGEEYSRKLQASKGLDVLYMTLKMYV
jgi:FkbM family methyltransferase